MQPVIEAARSALSSKPSPVCASFSPSTARKLAYIWARMAGRYGALWANSHGDRPGKVDMGEWGEAVGALSENQIREGFEADGFRGSDFPPSSTHFRAMCLGIVDASDLPVHRRPGAAMYQPVAPRSRRIESDTSREVASRELKKMRKLLRMSL